MEKKEFDKKVQELMTEFKENLDPLSWDNFEQKLQFEEEMDDLIRESMESYEEPFNEAHWQLLVNEIEKRKAKTIIKRTAEIAIIILLMLTAHNFYQYKGDSNQIKESISIASLENEWSQIENEVNITLSTPPYTTIANITVAPKTQVESNNLETHKWNNFNSNNYKSGIYPDNLIVNDTESLYKYHSDQKMIAEGSNREKNDLQGLERINIKPFNILDDHKYFMASLSLLSPGVKAKGLWIGILSGPEINFINSPFDLNLLKNPIRSQSGTFSFGVSISKDIGFIELISGLTVSNKNYFPFRIREFVPFIDQKYLETSLISLEFDQVQIPLLMNIHMPRFNGLSMYATIGLGANFITKTQYNVQTQVRSFSLVPTSSTGVESLNLRDLPRGALQSGNLGNNVFVSAIIGFGIEKRIFNKYAFSLTSTYQRSLSKEINPVINRTQQLGFTFGMKVNIK
ncbi:MAG: hypothetical protein V3V00_00305 [Saprospiraceae bacterium]